MTANYEVRYAENWGTIRRTALRATSDRCVRCLCRASEVHHLRYRDWRGAIALKAIEGVEEL